jgi:hypothetical protein
VARFAKLVGFLLCLLPALSMADVAAPLTSRRAFTAIVFTPLDFGRLLPPDPASERSEASGLNLPVTIAAPGIGRMRIKFDRRPASETEAYFLDEHGLMPDQQAVTLLQGTAYFKAAENWAAAAIYRVAGVPHLFVQFSRISRRRHQFRHYDLDFPLTGATRLFGRVERLTEPALRRFACLAAVTAAKTGPLSNRTAIAARNGSSAFRVADVGLYGDTSWYARHGQHSNAVMTRVLNAVDSMYRAQLGMTLHIRSQVVLKTMSFPHSEAVQKLNDLARAAYAHSIPGYPGADMYHLFTTENLDGSTVGIAYQINDDDLGVVCRFPKYSFSLTQYLGAVMAPLATAHEFGHLLGAIHPEGDRDTFPQPPAPSLMTGILPYVGSPPSWQRFSDYSINQIDAYLDLYGNCLVYQLPLTASLTSAGDFEATVEWPGSDLSECSLKLRGAPTLRALGKGAILARAAGTALPIRFQASALRRARCGPGGGGVFQACPVYIRADVVCPDGRTAISKAVKLRADLVDTAQQPVLLKNWLKLLRVSIVWSSVSE